MDHKYMPGGEVKPHEERANILENKVTGIDFGSNSNFNNSQFTRN